MSVIVLILILAFLGWLYYMSGRIPSAPMRTIAQVLLVIVAVVLVLVELGLWDQLRAVKVPKL